MDTFTTSVSLNAPADYEVVVEGMNLHFSPSGRQLLKRPFKACDPKQMRLGKNVILVQEPFSKQMAFPIYGIIFAFLSAKAVSLRKVLH